MHSDITCFSILENAFFDLSCKKEIHLNSYKITKGKSKMSLKLTFTYLCWGGIRGPLTRVKSLPPPCGAWWRAPLLPGLPHHSMMEFK